MTDQRPAAFSGKYPAHEAAARRKAERSDAVNSSSPFDPADPRWQTCLVGCRPAAKMHRTDCPNAAGRERPTFTRFGHGTRHGVAVSSMRRRCLVCERRAISSDVPETVQVRRVLSPSKRVHLVDDSGITFCGKDAAGWESEETPGA